MSIRVLIIDPNIPFMVTTKQALEATGEFEVSVSANGLAAQEALRQTRHDVAVIDFNVADMDVLELIGHLRRLQPDLRVLLTYSSDAQAARTPHLGAQGSIAKPYTARALIPHLFRAVTRHVPLQPPAEAATPPAEDETGEVPPRGPAPFTEVPDTAGEELAAADEQPPDEDAAPTDADLRRLAQTRYFGDEPDLGGTDALFEWQDTDRTGQLPKTDSLDGMLEQHGWLESEPTPPFLEDYLPPPQPDDTPTVPPQDLDGVRQFLATDLPEHDPTTFGEVLDALAQSPLPDTEPSPDDQAFHELVDSLRAPAAPPRRGPLDDLLAPRAPDSDEEPPPNPLDYVLESIRRGHPPQEPDLGDESELDDTTIGDVISGLFDPSFESVLAALAGKEVGEDDLAEPTYTAEETRAPSSLKPDIVDQIGLESLDTNAALPDWLASADLPEPGAPAAPPAHEPAPDEEDSWHYPATTALHAVTQDDAEAEFSLNDLLNQIEQQLPPPRDRRPRLRPLPSWEENATPEEAEQLRQLFPDSGEWEPADLEELFSPPAPLAGPAPDETAQPAFDEEPPLALPEAPEEHFDAGWTDEEAGEPAAEEALPAHFDRFRDQAQEAEVADSDERDEQDAVGDALELDLDADLIEAAQHAGPDDFFTGLPDIMEEEDTLATEISEAFYEGVRQTAYTWDESEGDTGQGEAAAPDWIPQPVEDGAGEPAVEEILPALDYPADEAARSAEPAEMPAAHLLIEEPEPEPEAPPPEDDEEAARLAQIALQLTQFSLESSAQATLLTSGGELIAEAGDLPAPALERLEQTIAVAWSTSPPDHDSLSRYVTLPDAGEFLLYSTAVGGGMVLSMVFSSNTSIRTIRRQARRLSEALDLVPEPVETPEAPAAVTHPSRPTDLRAPEGLRAARAGREQGAPVRHAPRPDVPYTSYCLLWLPWDPRLELEGDYAAALRGWIADIAARNAWEIDELDIETDYIRLTLKVPQKSLPDAVIQMLFDETARLTQEHFPERIDAAGRLWANGYYVVTPPRALSDREIGRFITYQRQAQAS